MVMDNEATEKTANIGRSRRTRPTPRRMVVEVAKTIGPGGSRGGPFLRVCGAQREGPWAGSVQMEPGGTQEGQGAKEDREPTALVPGVQVSARRVLGLLWQGKQPCTRPPSVQGV